MVDVSDSMRTVEWLRFTLVQAPEIILDHTPSAEKVHICANTSLTQQCGGLVFFVYFLLCVEVCYACCMKILLEEMGKLANEIIGNLEPCAQTAHIVALSGNLGAGKTTLTQHIARELGIREAVTSPTFVLMKQYSLNNQPFTQLVHIDAYRLDAPDELKTLRIDELFSNPQNLVLIEWPERVMELLPENKTTISLEVIDDTAREVAIVYTTK
jgi:tRNA threonylcarbamoyladenosine biosynthesis protein TsaE